MDDGSIIACVTNTTDEGVELLNDTPMAMWDTSDEQDAQLLVVRSNLQCCDVVVQIVVSLQFCSPVRRRCLRPQLARPLIFLWTVSLSVHSPLH